MLALFLKKRVKLPNLRSDHFNNLEKASSKNRTRIRLWTREKTGVTKNGPFRKTGLQGLKRWPFVSSYLEDNVKVIHFHVKSRGVQSLVFGQIMFEKCTTNLYFENGEVGIETTIANL